MSQLILPPFHCFTYLQFILQPFCCFTYITAHSPVLLSLLLCHRLFTWRAVHVFQYLDMAILPLQPTHHAQFSDTLLVIIITKNVDKVLTCRQLPVPDLSAHDFIYLSINLQYHKMTKKTISYGDLKRLSMIALTETHYDFLEKWFGLCTLMKKLVFSVN